MHRGNAFLIASALLLTGISACKYHPTVQPGNLLCHDDNGCPQGYYCVGVAGNQPGFCCVSQDAAVCLGSADALPAPGDSTAMDASSDGIAGVDSASADAAVSEVAGSQPRILHGPCIEGMECNGNDPGGSLEFRCACTAGNWVCPLHDSQDWLNGDLPLPAEDPQHGTTCNGANYACTLPDRCGSLCICTQTQQWNCKTLQSDVDGGLVVSEGVPDAGTSDSPDAGCAWPSCSVYGLQPPPGVSCFTPVCFSTVYPSGSAFFTPVDGCSRER